jgi:hypothetical protein
MLKSITKPPFLLKSLHTLGKSFTNMLQTWGKRIEIITIPEKNPLEEAIMQLNRNARKPKRANHGARPCSSYMRRLRKKNIYKKWKEEVPIEPMDENYRSFDERNPIELEEDEEEAEEKKPAQPTS